MSFVSCTSCSFPFLDVFDRLHASIKLTENRNTYKATCRISFHFVITVFPKIYLFNKIQFRDELLVGTQKVTKTDTNKKYEVHAYTALVKKIRPVRTGQIGPNVQLKAISERRTKSVKRKRAVCKSIARKQSRYTVKNGSQKKQSPLFLQFY